MIGRATELTLLAAAVAVVGWVYLKGQSAALTRIEMQNDKAEDIADEADLDRLECLDAGRMWHFDTGHCGGSL